MTRRRSLRCLRPRAFTLVELVLVMMLMAILAAAARPRYVAALANYRANAAAGRVAADLRMVRQYARKVSEPQSVVFDPTGNTYAASTLPDLNQPDIGYSVSLLTSEYQSDIVSASFGGSATVQFDIYGRPSAAGTVVLTAGGVQRTVEVNEVGHVRIL
jgi:prepilin-type N-terminal cleavage/methylation domain-containing protein